ncbi:lysylphosphatidylglycerol synthase transmembrane domain-containing protein [Pseudoxanthomonas dokdonensis]|uniref:Uncharacterized protein n=1 Tax=Pseudoxanthomonas dokdonensis TaxID=344882 RepID=A0A0R0CI89_9GAMM|nr:lysylphosphatidylglycerol synthase transmembrane domain-containing protein [Pseudoxanthomonas dokdonensis]KRG69625.1 hypothetical protein ABB29_09145 [Pseudoxanthomonas dokdonensis]
MKRVIATLGLILSAACLALFVIALSKQWHAIETISFDISDSLLVGISVIMYAASYLVLAKAWQLLLRIEGVGIHYQTSLDVIARSQIGKYLPGNIGQHIGRIFLAKRLGIDSTRCISSMVLETIIVIATASIFSLFALDLLPEISARYGASLLRTLTVAIAILVVFATMAFLFRRVRHQLHRSIYVLREVISKPEPRKLLCYTMMLQALNFLLGTASIWLVVSGVSDAAVPAYASIIGIYAVSWLVGFMVPGAPAGLGVREALLVLGLSQLYGLEAAIAATALFRLVTILGDGFSYFAGLALSTRSINQTRP